MPYCAYTREEISKEFFEEMLQRTASRGPDKSRTLKVKDGWLGFNRLAIMGLNCKGMQPFELNGNAVICTNSSDCIKSIKGEIGNKEYVIPYFMSIQQV